MSVSHSGSDTGGLQLEQLFTSALSAALPVNCLQGHWPALPAGRLAVLAIGKAAVSMAAEAVRHYRHDANGLVLVPDHHYQDLALPDRFAVIQSSHPFPDQRSVDAADSALTFAAGLNESDLMLVLLSGGGSSVMCKPREGLSLAQKQATIRQLQYAGASISELNTVRKQLSAIKGGRLAAATCARVVTLAISDVPGDKPSLISSGPTTCDAGTAAEALEILNCYRLAPGETVQQLLRQEATPFVTEHARDRDGFTVVANGNTMLEKAELELKNAGYEVINFGDRLESDAGELAIAHAKLAIDLVGKKGRYGIISGGETSVVMSGETGKGGRNTEFLLALTCALNGVDGIRALACDSDGIDGKGSHAGACIGPDTLQRAMGLGLDPQNFLRRHDSASFFGYLDDLVVTGPIQTNVNDFRVILVE
jgi:hydroxypyruvate reductase